jgi:hypothetical protein
MPVLVVLLQLRYHLRELARLFERLPGAKGFPNLHYAQHIVDKVLDYGLPSAKDSWSCERFIGDLGDINTNAHNIETTLCRRWTERDLLFTLPFVTGEWRAMSDAQRQLYCKLHGTTVPPDVVPLAIDVAAQLLCDRWRTTTAVGDGRLRLLGTEPFIGALLLPTRPAPDLCADALEIAKVANEKDKSRLENDYACYRQLQSYLRSAYPRAEVVSITLSPSCPRSTRLQLFGDIVGVANSRYKRASWVMVRSGTRMCPAQCLSFAQVTADLTMIDGKVSQRVHHLAQLR